MADISKAGCPNPICVNEHTILKPLVALSVKSMYAMLNLEDVGVSDRLLLVSKAIRPDVVDSRGDTMNFTSSRGTLE